MPIDNSPSTDGIEQADTPLSMNDALGMLRDRRQPEADEPQQEAAPDDAPEPEESESEEAVEEPEPDEPSEPQLAADDVFVEIEGGEKLTVRELKDSYFRQEDYSRKTQEVSKERKDLQALGQRFHQSIEQVAGYLASRLPPEPDPKLAYIEPGQHYQQKLARDTAMQEIMGLLQFGEGVKEAQASVSEADLKAQFSAENDLLVRKMPHLKEPKRLEAFDRKVADYAKAIGFPEEMIKATADHRVRIMAYDAAEGREARAARAKAQAKVKAAAPMLPAKQRQHPNSVRALNVINATQKLEQSGSINDALAVLRAQR